MSGVSIADEAHLFWRVASEAREIRRASAENPTIAQQDDLESLVIHSDWPRLQERARSTIAELQGQTSARAEEAACESSA